MATIQRSILRCHVCDPSSACSGTKMPPPAFLLQALAHDESHPLITLTYAQSLDASIAGRNREQIRLSGEESMLMTHWMRTLHDGIMVGVGTAIADDPRLNVRLLPQAEHSRTPQPIILDPKCRLPTTARLFTTLKDPETPHAKPPWIICRKDNANFNDLGDDGFQRRRQALVEAGARLLEVDMRDDNRLDLSKLPSLLEELGIKSLMVEGGAEIIRQFAAYRIPNDMRLEENPHRLMTKARPLVDRLIVTVAPVFVPDGYSVRSLPGEKAAESMHEHVRTEISGRDAVMVFRAKK